MTTSLERRLQKMEAEVNPNPMANMPDEDLDRVIDDSLAKLGATREQVMTRHGSIETFARLLRQALRNDERCKSEDALPSDQLIAAIVRGDKEK